MQNSERPSDTVQDRLRRGIWIIALVFVVVLAGTFGYFRATGTTSQYKTVVVVAPPGSVTNPAEALQYVGNFRAALASDVVAQRVADDVGLSRATVRRRIASERQGDSALIKVTYTSDSRGEDSKQVIAEAVRQTGRFLADGRSATTKGALAETENDLEAATDAATEADAAVTQFLADNGGVAPTETASALEARIVELTLDQAQAEASGNSAAAAVASRDRTALEAQLADTRLSVTLYAPLAQAAESAHLQLESADEARREALTAVAQNQDAVEFDYTKVNGSVSQTQTWLRQSIAIAAAAAIITALVIAWLPAGRFARRRTNVRRASTPGPAA